MYVYMIYPDHNNLKKMTDNAEIHQEKSDVKNKHIYHHLT